MNIKYFLEKLGSLLVIAFVIISTSIIFYFSYKSNNKDIMDEIDNKILHELSILSIASEDVFNKYNNILTMLGNNILTYPNKQKYLNMALELEPDAVGYGFISPDGDILINSSNVDVKKIPNFISNPKTKESFLKTLKCKSSILGRSYLFRPTNQLIIPIRKSIRKNSKVYGVLAVDININKSFSNLFTNKIHNDSIILLIKNNSSRIQYSNINDFKIDSIIKIDVHNLFKKTNQISLTTTSLNNTKYKVGVKFIERYDLWLVIGFPSKIIDSLKNDWLINAVSIWFAFNISFIIMMFIINKINNERKNELEYISIHDPLTHVGNRYYLNKKIVNYKHYSMLFLDLDNFKFINDNFGHNYGDNFLISIATELKKNISSDDLLIRFSGDEFIIITREMNKEKVISFAKSLLNITNDKFKYEHKTTMSIGIAQCEGFEDLHSVKYKADLALYKAKEKQNTIVFYDKNIEETFKEEHLIENKLLEGIILKEIFMVYQPQLNTKNKIVGVEALVRWNNSKLGQISPETFIKIAEKNENIIILGDYILDYVFNDINKFKKIVPKDFNISINISIKQFMEDGFVQKIKNKMNQFNINPHNITLEVTENLFILDLTHMEQIIDGLHQLGVKISIDDFGTGYSSLSSVKNLTIDEIKIDKAFVDDIVHDNISKSMAEVIIKMSKIFNTIIIAEGIENSKQKEILDRLGCDFYQGYYFSKPLTLDNLKKFIKNNI